MKQLKAKVSGRVQGVSFRYYTRRQAERLNLTGWVRNERDGSVQVVAEGNENVLKQFVEFLHRGSPAARVSQVEVDWAPAGHQFDHFEIRL